MTTPLSSSAHPFPLPLFSKAAVESPCPSHTLQRSLLISMTNFIFQETTKQKSFHLSSLHVYNKDCLSCFPVFNHLVMGVDILALDFSRMVWKHYHFHQHSVPVYLCVVCSLTQMKCSLWPFSFLSGLTRNIYIVYISDIHLKSLFITQHQSHFHIISIHSYCNICKQLCALSPYFLQRAVSFLNIL